MRLAIDSFNVKNNIDILSTSIKNDHVFNRITDVIKPIFNCKKEFEKFSDSLLFFSDIQLSQNDIILGSKSIFDNFNTVIEASINEKRLNHISDELKHHNFSSYLDFGCGDGSQTSYLSQSMNISNSNSFGIDIHDNEYHSNFINLNYSDFNSIPLPSGSIDFVSSFMVLHHVQDLFHSVKEIHRVLSVNGVLFIRETDIKGYNDILFNHSMEIFYYKIMTEHESNSAPLYFNSYSFWINIITSMGFELIKSDSVEDWNHFNPIHLYFRKI